MPFAVRSDRFKFRIQKFKFKYSKFFSADGVARGHDCPDELYELMDEAIKKYKGSPKDAASMIKRVGFQQYNKKIQVKGNI